MYQYLYLIDILSSLNSTLNTINIFIFFLSLFVFFIYLISDKEEILKKCKKILNIKVFIA